MSFSVWHITRPNRKTHRNRYKIFPFDLLWSRKFDINEDNHLSNVTGIPPWLITIFALMKLLPFICALCPFVFLKPYLSDFYFVVIFLFGLFVGFAIPFPLWYLAWIKYGKRL